MSDGCSEYSINKISASIKSLQLVFIILPSELGISYAQPHQSAPAALYRDSVTDGPADPVLIDLEPGRKIVADALYAASRQC